MMSFISLPAVLEKIMQDPTYKSGKFGEIKELILGMLDTYNYELTLLRTTHNLLGRDLHGQYKQQQRFLSHGFKPNSLKCTLCSRPFNIDGGVNKGDLIIFRCGHTFHKSCLEGSIGFEGELICLQCNRSNAINTVTYRRSNSRSADKNGKTPIKKLGADKRVDFQVNLTHDQLNALNRVWNQGSQNTKSALMAELMSDRSPDWSSVTRSHTYGRSNSLVEKSSMSNEKFALKLAPPTLRNNYS